MTGKDLVELMVKEGEMLTNLTKVERVKITRLELLKILIRGHFNKLREGFLEFTKDKKNYNKFVSVYNKEIDKFEKAGMSINKVFREGDKMASEVLKPALERIAKINTYRMNMSQSMLESKVAYYKDLIKYKDNVGLFQPQRITLLKSSGFKDVKGTKKFIKFTTSFEKEINTMIEKEFLKKNVNAGSLIQRVHKNIENKVGSDRIFYPKKKGFGSINLRNYAEGYVKDLQTIQNNYAVLSASVVSGNDLVFIAGPLKTDPLCGQYAGKTFSITGQTSGYQTLTVSPPYHRNCQHTITTYYKGITTANKQGEELRQRTNEEIRKSFKQIINAVSKKSIG